METQRSASKPSKIRWSFWNAPLAVLFLAAVGQAVGHMLHDYPPKLALQRLLAGDAAGAADILGSLFGRMVGRDWLFTAFVVATLGFVWLEREGIARFFRSMYTGVSLVVLSTLAILAGVLVPQIDGFEDPEKRVNLEREHEKYRLYAEQGYLRPDQKLDGHTQYEQFRWAEGYFIYHLMHLYGFGMPEAKLPEGVADGLERYGRRYGQAEVQNREKAMLAATAGLEKTQEIGAWINAHEDFLWRFFKVATLLELNRAYKSNWFAALLFMLATSVTLNSLKGGPRRFLSIEKLGYNLAHMGMLTLLAGGFVSSLTTDRGILQLDLRDQRPQDTYLRHFDPRQRAQMPFGVTLEHFARKEWRALEVYFEGDSFSSKVPSYTLWPGRTIDLDYVPDESREGELRPRLRIAVEALHDRAEVHLPTIHEAPADDRETDEFPIAVIRTGSLQDPGVEDSGWLLPESPKPTLEDPVGRWRLHAAFGTDPQSVFPRDEGVLGDLLVSLAAHDVQPVAYDLVEQGALAVQGGYEVEVLAATANFRVSGSEPVLDPRPLAEQPLGVPAVRVRVSSASGESEERWLIQGIDPVEYNLQAGYAFPELVLRLAWDAWRAPGPPRFVLDWGVERELTLTDEQGEARAIALGQPLPIPGPTRVFVDDVLVRPVFESLNLKFLPPTESPAGSWEADFYSRDPRGLELLVTTDPDTPQASVQTFQMTTSEEFASNFAQSADGSFQLRFFENSAGFPYEWRSVLQVHERDGQGAWQPVDFGPDKKAREIRVNDYLQYRGYRFFQTGADPEIPTYSGIGVVYDPGIPIVLAGMYTVIAGTVVAFLVRPVVLARRKRRAEAV